MSTTPQVDLKNPTPETHLLTFQQWGWQVRLCKKGTAVSLVLSTPSKRGYSLEVDEEGNVVEHISGSYLRIVDGSVEEKTLGMTIQASGGPHIMRSEEHTIISAPEIHFNPVEFKEEK